MSKPEVSKQIVNEDTVLQFLQKNPDCLARLVTENPTMLDSISSLSPDEQESVVDFQRHRINQLRDDLALKIDFHDELIDTSRTNLKSQHQIHDVALSLMALPDIESFLGYISRDLPDILHVDAVVLCIEEADKNKAALPDPVVVVPPQIIAACFPNSASTLLGTPQENSAQFFGPAANLIKSQALLRLALDDVLAPALLAIGDRDSNNFHTGQATHLLRFLGDVLTLRLKQILQAD